MMVDKNYDSLSKLNNISKGEFNMVFEQFLAYCLCCENKVNLQVILKGEYRLSDFVIYLIMRHIYILLVHLKNLLI